MRYFVGCFYPNKFWNSGGWNLRLWNSRFSNIWISEFCIRWEFFRMLEFRGLKIEKSQASKFGDFSQNFEFVWSSFAIRRSWNFRLSSLGISQMHLQKKFRPEYRNSETRRDFGILGSLSVKYLRFFCSCVNFEVSKFLNFKIRQSLNL